LNTTIPAYIQHAWAFYNSTGDLLTNLWESYQDDFLKYYFPEVTGILDRAGEPDHPDLADEDDIPF
jgi:hypothetical protein